ncbi:MAG: chemotaxis response regulator protein-glutamate methylesterase [Treponema sp.]|nr:chemotaxis response regulator protein-glutamate methylesterase [Treponema sp.]
MPLNNTQLEDISVLICDDSALMRNLIGRIIEDTDGLKVVGKAENGADLLEKLKTIKPDVILLDIEMPKMNGIEFLQKRKELNIDIPVIILSSIALEGAAVTKRCLELGASDFITKPGGYSVSIHISDVSSEIVDYVSSYGGKYAARHGKNVPSTDYFSHQLKLKEAARFVAQKKGEDVQKVEAAATKQIIAHSYVPPKPKEPAVIVPEREGGRIEIIAIGISTGGPNALREMFRALDPGLKQPILVVQHMPAGFTAEFAASLDNICPLKVTEAKDGEAIMSGHIYIAPGGYHMIVERHPIGNTIRLNQEPLRNGHRPSCDMLFESVASIYQNRALGVIMTGMGRDGAAQIAEMRKKGAWTLGQDAASSVVYGMPKVAWEMGGVQKQVPLSELAAAVNTLAKEHQFN